MLEVVFKKMSDILTNDFDDMSIEKYKNLDEEYATTVGHHTLGRALRNEWGLWEKNELTDWFNSIGIHHADDMSAIITTSFHRHINDKDIDLDGQVLEYKNYWEEMEKTRDANSGYIIEIDKTNGVIKFKGMTKK